MGGSKVLSTGCEFSQLSEQPSASAAGGISCETASSNLGAGFQVLLARGQPRPGKGTHPKLLSLADSLVQRPACS